MCILSRAVPAIVSGQAPRNDAPTITGKQKGVADPIDTSKATALLKAQRENAQYQQGLKIMTSGGTPNDLKIM